MKNGKGKRRTALWLGVLLLSSLFLKGVLWYDVARQHPEAFLRPDSASYLESATALLTLGRFVVAPRLPDEPMLFRTPGYPAFLAVMGLPTGTIDAVVVVFIQILLHLFILLLVYWLGVRLWNPAVGILAVALVALDMPTFAYTLFVLSETQFALLVLALVVLLVRWSTQPAGGQAKALWTWFCAGLLLALATLTRPISYYLPIPLSLLCMWYGWWHGWSWRQVIVALIIFLCPILILVGGWQLRNFRLTGINEFSTVTATNLFLYRGAGVVALRDGIPFETAQEELRQEIAALPTRKEQVAYMKTAGFALLRQSPLLTVRTQIEGALRMLLGPGDGALRILLTGNVTAVSSGWQLLDAEDGPPTSDHAMLWHWGVLGVALGELFVIYSGIAWWLWFALRRVLANRWQIEFAHVVLWLALSYLIVISAGPEANSRFRTPIVPLLALYGAAGWQMAVSKRQNASDKEAYENLNVVN